MSTTRKVPSKHEEKPRLLLDLMVSATDPEENIATELCKKLYEPKSELILRMVQLIGGEKAIELFKETQKVEEAGGMMIMSGKRRRTSGGIYLFLMSQDAALPKDKIKQIVKEDHKKYLSKIKTLRANTQQITKELLRQNLSADSETPSVSRAEAEIPSEQKSNPPPPETDASDDGSYDTDTDDEEDFHMGHPEQPKPCVLCCMEQNRRAEIMNLSARSVRMILTSVLNS